MVMLAEYWRLISVGPDFLNDILSEQDFLKDSANAELTDQCIK
jgi:hypothetical protein